MNKQCQLCDQLLSVDQFRKDASKKDGMLIYCGPCIKAKCSKRYRENHERYLSYAKNYRDTHKDSHLYKLSKKLSDEKYRETHKEQIQEHYIANRDSLLAAKRARRKRQKIECPEYCLLEASRCRASKKGLEHTLILSDIIIPTNCPVLGIPLFTSEKTATDNSPTIDRIDNKKGYTKDNVIVVSHRANSIKRNASIDELEKIYKFYKSTEEL